MIVTNLHRQFPRDVWPSVWNRVEEIGEAGRAFLPRQVLIELERVDDDCAPWCKNFDGFVVEAEADEVELVAQIAQLHGEWVAPQRNEADPWLVAHAMARDRHLVTDERMKGPGTADRNLKIPNVATEFGATCLDFNSLARQEGWSF
jgi:hypothetical protein